MLRLRGRSRLLALVLGGLLAVVALPAALTLANEGLMPTEDSTESESPSDDGAVGGDEDGDAVPDEGAGDGSEEQPADGAGGEEPPAEVEDPPADTGPLPPEEAPVPAPDGAPAGDLGEDRSADLPEGAEAAPGEILVRFRRGADPEEREGARDEVGAEVEEALPVPDLQLVTVDSRAVGDEIDALEEDPAVLYAEPNLERRVDLTPSDDDFLRLYGLNNEGQDFTSGRRGTPNADIDAPQAWDDTTGSSDVKVAVVDTGIDGAHPDLVSNLGTGAGYDFFSEDSDPTDENGHGTHVAGTIGAQGDNDAGVTGVNWDTTLIAMRAFGPNGSGSTSDVIQAYGYADAIGADVLNASFGGAGYSQAEFDAIARADDTLFVAAAGNERADNDVTPSYPCNYSLANVVCVAASDENDQLASFSNYGNSVDLAAPGSRIYSTTRGGGYGYLSGTSMATPHVAGTAALVAAQRPSSSVADLRDDLLDGVDVKPALTSVGSSGRLNADRSVAGSGTGGDVGTGAPPPDPISPSPSPTPQPSPGNGESGGNDSDGGSGGGSGGGGGGGSGGGGSGGGGSGGGGGGGGGSGGSAGPGVPPVLPAPGTTTPAPATRRPSRCSRLRGARRVRCVKRARALARCRKLAPSKRRACIVRARRAAGR